jgi:glycosyltransferase involved in cell wall biosynthesis
VTEPVEVRDAVLLALSFRGGMAQYALGTATAMRCGGWRPLLVVPYGAAPVGVPSVELATQKAVREVSTWRPAAAATWRTFRLLRTRRAEPWVVVTSHPLSIVLVLLCRPSRVVVVVHDAREHAGIRAATRLVRLVSRSLERKVATELVVHSEVDRRLVAPGPGPDLVTVIPHLVASAQSGVVTGGGLALGIVGRVGRYKGLATIRRALGTPGTDLAGATLVIAGQPVTPRDVIDATELAVEWRRRGGTADVTLSVLSDEEVAAHHARLSAVLCVYEDVTTSGAVARALGYGVPVVATDVPVLREYLDDLPGVFFIRPNDVTSRFGALVRELADAGPEELRRTGERLRARAIERYGLTPTGERWNAVLRAAGG